MHLVSSSSGSRVGNTPGWAHRLAMTLGGELLCLSLLSHGRLSDIRLEGQDQGRDQTASISDCLQVPAFLYPLCHIFQLNYMPFLPSPRFLSPFLTLEIV